MEKINEHTMKSMLLINEISPSLHREQSMLAMASQIAQLLDSSVGGWALFSGTWLKIMAIGYSSFHKILSLSLANPNENI